MTIDQLSKLENLRILNIEYGGFHRYNLKKVATIKSLRTLIISGLDIRDDDVENLTDMQLIVLPMPRNNLSDAGLMKLAKISTLRALEIKDCPRVTAIGAARFHKLLPTCKLIK